MSGHLITFEGTDGSGKTEQVKRLAAALRKRGHEVVETKEPGACRQGATIRHLLFNDPTTHRMAPGQGDCLFLYDHIGHVHDVIKPNLAAGRIVISDRYADSQFAYAVAKKTVKCMNDAFHSLYGVIPDITVLLIGDVPLMLSRARSRPGAEGAKKQAGKEWDSPALAERIQQAFILNLGTEPRTILIKMLPEEDLDAIAKRVETAVVARLELLEREGPNQGGLFGGVAEARA